MELEDNHVHIRQRSEGWECYNLCDMVIGLGSSTCLCFCNQHRDECPVHDASRLVKFTGRNARQELEWK
jgi:hypothetical protein